MLSLTEKERAVMAQNVAYILSLSDVNANAKEIMSRAYQEFMQDKTDLQGDLMAQQLLDKMGDYITAEELAVADAGLLAAYQIDRILEAKTLQQQCQILHSFIQGLHYFDTDFVRNLSCEGIPRETVAAAEGDEDLAPYTGPVTEEARDRLRTQAIQAVAHASLSDDTLKTLEQLMDRDHISAHLVLTGRTDDYLFQATSAMVIYCMAKNGQLTRVPREITMDQVVLTVCAEESMRQLRGNLAKGYITVEQYKHRMTASWNAKKVLLVAGFAVLGTAAVVVSLKNYRFDWAFLAAAAAMYGIFMCLGSMDQFMKEMIAQEAASLLQVDVSVTNHTEEILKKYRNYEDTLVQTPVEAPWRHDEESLWAAQQQYVPLGGF